MHKTSSKFKKIIKNCSKNTCNSTIVEYYNDPTELIDKLEIIVGSLKTGNTSTELINEGMVIIDELLQNGYINIEQHEELYNKLI